MKTRKKAFERTVYLDIEGQRIEKQKPRLQPDNLILRYSLVVLMVVALMECFISAYQIKYDLLPVIFISLIAVAAFYCMLTSKHLSILITGIFCCIAIYIIVSNRLLRSIAEGFVYTYNYLLNQINRDFFPTRGFMTLAPSAVAENSSELASAFAITMPILILFVAFLFTLFLHRKVRLAPCALLIIVFLAPAIETAMLPSSAAFGLLVSACLGAYVLGINQVLDRQVEHQRKVERRNARRLRKKQASLNTNAKAAAPLPAKQTDRKRFAYRFGLYGVPAAIGCTLCLVSFATANLFVPKDAMLANEKVLKKAVEIGNGIAQAAVDAYANGPDLSFLQDFVLGNDFNISLGIYGTKNLSVKAPRLTDREVLRVDSYTPNPDYLRSNIGVDFVNGSWTTFDDAYNNAYTALGMSDFSPEAMPFLSSEYFADEKIMFYGGPVTLTYLSKSNLFLLPMIPVTSPVSNDNRVILTGDTVGRPEPGYKLESYRAEVALQDYGTHFHQWYSDYLKNYESNARAAAKSDDKVSSIVRNIDVYNEFVNQHYTAVPEDMAGDIHTLAQSVTKTDDNAYQKAMDINNYLYSNYTYSLQRQYSNKGLDDVRCFLFETKQGHCSLYASSMVLMLRTLGIPARYCTGFVARPDTAAPDDLLSSSNIIYSVTLRENDSHAWVEVYLENYGWMTFDPTGIGPSPTDASSGEPQPEQSITAPADPSMTAPEFTTPPVNTPQTQQEEQAQQGFAIHPLLLLGIIVFVLAVAFVLTIRGLIRSSDSRIRKGFHQLAHIESTLAVERIYTFTMKLLTLYGLVPATGEQPQEFGQRVDKLLRVRGAKLREVMRIFEGREFGSCEATQEEHDLALCYLEGLYYRLLMNCSWVQWFFLKVRFAWILHL